MLHTRLNWITADTVALDECVTYVEREIRSALEARPGSLGISVLEDRERGVAIFGSIWATSTEMGGSENTEAPMRAELAKRAGAPVSVEDYQVPIFELVERQALTRRSHAVRLTRMRVRPSQVDDVIEVVGDIVVPSHRDAWVLRRATVRRPGFGGPDQRDCVARPRGTRGRPEHRLDRSDRSP